MKTTSIFIFIFILFSIKLSAQGWIKADTIPSAPIIALALDGDTILAASGGNIVYQSKDLGQTWNKLIVGYNTTLIISFRVIDGTIYAGTSNSGIFYSSDHGRNWKNTGSNLFAITGIEKYGAHIYASTLGQGVVQWNTSTDQWVPFNPELPDYSANVFTFTQTSKGLIIGAGRNGTFYRYDSLNGIWQEGYYYGFLKPNLQIDQILCHQDTLFAVNGSKIFRSNNGGDSWVIDSVNALNGYSRSISLDNNNHYILTNTIQNNTWIQQRGRFAEAGDSWSSMDEFIPESYAFDILSFRDMVFLARREGLYFRKPEMNTGVSVVVSKPDFSVFPNPSAGDPIAISGNSIVSHYSFRNTLGQVIEEGSVGKATFTLQNRPEKGVYFITLFFSEGQTMTQRISIN